MERVASCLRLDILYRFEWRLSDCKVDGILQNIGDGAGFYRQSHQLLVPFRKDASADLAS
jgi:hypothetical protein